MTDSASSSLHWREIFFAFLKLGLTSFGGPVAHLGYFRDELITRRKWLTDESYGDLVALCQFLPGPASSQVGFALGLCRGGWVGGLLAWLAFTLPSALLLVLFAIEAEAMGGVVGQGLLHGLKLVAVAVVAQAVWGMARVLCPDRARATIAVAAVILLVALPSTYGQLGAILMGAACGLRVCRALPTRDQHPLPLAVSRSTSILALVLFAVLLFLLPVVATVFDSRELALVDAFYRAGALVFGGGHVVLPLLQVSTVASGWINPDAFLAGYGMTQAVPGPLFTFSAYLGYMASANGLLGALLSLMAIFLPGFLLVAGTLPFWVVLRQKPKAQAAMAGANAAVVGVLGAALYQPVWSSAVFDTQDFAVALAAFVLLTVWKLAPWKVVLITAAAGLAVFKL